MMSQEIVEQVTQSYKILLAYHQQVGSLFKLLDKRFSSENNGKKLIPLSVDKLFAVCDDEYMLLDHYTLSNRQQPYDTGLPFWLGRFYVDADRLIGDRCIDDYFAQEIPYMAFVWIWVGCDDPNVADVEEPECWIAIVDPQPNNPETRLYDMAEMVWKFIRIETTTEKEEDGWICGRFYPNSLGCELNGVWKVQRFPLKDLSSLYDIYQQIINPLTHKMAGL
ncbi:hypothetical protein [Roseofilum sp. Guam]|uniref:hypothetical protein n=1 Tax=Roseofilum sp. Guam TaxID=2821502 RepID=UPI001B2555E6|nr:hypothetical protein [Roseofilum sp. Guam]MBP0031097.1 hypothetical protein [Roseofilum sp. Guam]